MLRCPIRNDNERANDNARLNATSSALSTTLPSMKLAFRSPRKSVTLRVGQRMIAMFLPKVHIWSEKPAEEISQYIFKNICDTSLFFSHNIFVIGTEIARVTKRKRHSRQPCKFLTDKNARWTIDRVYIGYIVFAGQGHQKIIEVMMLVKMWRKC